MAKRPHKTRIRDIMGNFRMLAGHAPVPPRSQRPKWAFPVAREPCPNSRTRLRRMRRRFARRYGVFSTAGGSAGFKTRTRPTASNQHRQPGPATRRLTCGGNGATERGVRGAVRIGAVMVCLVAPAGMVLGHQIRHPGLIARRSGHATLASDSR